MTQSEADRPNEAARLVRATRISLLGLRAAWREEAAFRTEVVLVVVLTPVALWAAARPLEAAVALMSLYLVPIVELLNSAVEAVVDRIGPEHHELAGRAKDIGSAAVFVSLLQFCVVWALIFGPVLLGS